MFVATPISVSLHKNTLSSESKVCCGGQREGQVRPHRAAEKITLLDTPQRMGLCRREQYTERHAHSPRAAWLQRGIGVAKLEARSSAPPHTTNFLGGAQLSLSRLTGYVMCFHTCEMPLVTPHLSHRSSSIRAHHTSPTPSCHLRCTPHTAIEFQQTRSPRRSNLVLYRGVGRQLERGG